MELFGTEGFHETSVQQLVERAGLTKGAYYHHFDSKEDVLGVIHDSFIDAHLRSQLRIRELCPDPVERMFHLVRALVLSVARHQDQVTIFFRDWQQLSRSRYRASFDKREAATELYVDTVRLGQEQGAFRAELDPELAAMAVLGMGNWLHQWFRPDGRADPRDIALHFATQALLGVTADAAGVLALVARPLPDPDPADEPTA